MWGRLLGLVAGLALVGEAFVLWRPEAVGGLASPDLGPFSPYRLIIAALAAVVGAAVIVAAILREPARPKARAVAKPAGFDFDAAAVQPPAEAPAVGEPSPLFHVPASAPDPVQAPPALQTHAAADAHEPEALAPFPAEGVEAQVEPPPPAPEPSPIHAPAAAVEARGTFLSAIDAGDQMRAANRLDDALELYDGALALARRAHVASPSDPTSSRDLALVLTSLADIHDREGRLESPSPCTRRASA